MGLLDDDTEFIDAIKEGARWGTGNTIRRLFVSMLLCCCLQRPEHVWEACVQELSEDQLYIPKRNQRFTGNMSLKLCYLALNLILC